MDAIATAGLTFIRRMLSGTKMTEEIVPSDKLDAELSYLRLKAQQPDVEVRKFHDPESGMCGFIAIKKGFPRLIP